MQEADSHEIMEEGSTPSHHIDSGVTDMTIGGSIMENIEKLTMRGEIGLEHMVTSMVTGGSMIGRLNETGSMMKEKCVQYPLNQL